ncbi:MAG TPA: metalloregulator ArsR/SmtB family transcription factor [Thermoanaerobaculia bacterium]|nr:metalloregulator ArsR/SmtB family transcription factor [Thermoanaerobaculia bacterium]
MKKKSPSRRPDPGLEEIFAALSDRTRLRILNLLALGEICVCYFTEIIGAPQPTISRHLAYLRRTGLVTTRRDGKWIHYRAASEPRSRAARILAAVLGEMRKDRELQADLIALESACCAVKLPASLAGAPRPTLGR